MTAWLLLVLAGLLEVGWAIGLKQSSGKNFWATLWPFASAIASFLLLAQSLKTLPVGTAYAVWVGIGALGVAIAGILLFGESANWLRLTFLGLIIAGVAGLKIVGDTK